MVTSGTFVDVLVGYAVGMATCYRLKVWVNPVCLVSPADAVKCTTYTNQQQQQNGYMVMETRTFPLVSATATRGENSREQGSFVPRPTPFCRFSASVYYCQHKLKTKNGVGLGTRQGSLSLPGLPVWSMSTTFNAINDPRGCVAQLMDEGGSDSLWRRGGSMQNAFLLKDGAIWYTYHTNHRLWWRALYERAWTPQIWSKMGKRSLILLNHPTLIFLAILLTPDCSSIQPLCVACCST